MLSAERMRRLSKFLSLVLRHQPERCGLELDAQGFVPVAELLAAPVRPPLHEHRAGARRRPAPQPISHRPHDPRPRSVAGRCEVLPARAAALSCGGGARRVRPAGMIADEIGDRRWRQVIAKRAYGLRSRQARFAGGDVLPPNPAPIAARSREYHPRAPCRCKLEGQRENASRLRTSLAVRNLLAPSPRGTVS